MDKPDQTPMGDLETVTALTEPVRQDLYGFVARSKVPVSRDEAASAVNVSRQVAAYHLDRLAEDGLLDVEFRRLTGLAGPGAGRPSKLYTRSDRTYEVSIPPRRYGLAAQILLDVIGEEGLDRGLLAKVARRAGEKIGAQGMSQALISTGYEPAVEDQETRFINCPFHTLKEKDRDTTCSLNLALVEGMIEGSDAETKAFLEPEDGYCCVRLRPPLET